MSCEPQSGQPLDSEQAACTVSNSRISVNFEAIVGTFGLNVQFEAEPGIIVLFGPSGCGKTTTLNCIAGLHKPIAGSIKLGEMTFYESSRRIYLPAQRRSLGYVFQRGSLFPHLSVLDNILFGIDRWPSARQRERMNYLLSMFELEELQRRRPHQLSGGQAQRVALARALAPEPKLLLLDEPFSALDLDAREQLGLELKRLHDLLNLPMIMVTHSPDEAARLAHLVVHMDAGKTTFPKRLDEPNADGKP